MALLTPTSTARPGRWRARLRWALALLGACPSAFGSEVANENEVRAAFLLHFVAFVEWPRHAFAAPEAPLVVGTYGLDPFGETLDRMFRGETVRGRPLVIRRIPAGGDPAGCHMLFVCDSERHQLGAVLRRVRGQPVLTVSSLEGFNAAGGIIQLVTERGRIRFRINQLAAQEGELTLSSRLLRLAQNL